MLDLVSQVNRRFISEFPEFLSFLEKLKYVLTVIDRALTHTQPHPAKERSHSHTPSQKKVTLTHTQPKKGHTHPHPPTPNQKKVTLTTPSHT